MRRSVSFLPLLFTACIGSITGGEDDKPDPPPPPEPEPVKLLVRDGTKPMPGVKVVFTANDDSLVADVTTDANGVASAKLPNGGNVHVIRSFPPIVGQPESPPDRVWTYTGVKPGDAIELVGAVIDSTPVSAAVNVGLTNGETVVVQTRCGGGAGQAPAIAVQLDGCGDETDFLIVNLTGETDPNDGTNSGPLYAMMRAKVTPAIDLGGADFRGTLSTQYSASNMGTGGNPYLQKRLVTEDGFTVFDTGPVPATTTTADVPELPTTEMITTAYVHYPNEMPVSISMRAAFSSAPVTIDVAPYMLPTSRAPQLAGSIFSWSQDGTGTPDLSIASITVGAQDRRFVRTIASAYSGTQLSVPALPAPHDKYNVKPTDTPRLDHYLVRVTGGYDAVRARVFNRAGADIVPMGSTAAASYPASTIPPDQKL